MSSWGRQGHFLFLPIMGCGVQVFEIAPGPKIGIVPRLLRILGGGCNNASRFKHHAPEQMRNVGREFLYAHTYQSVLAHGTLKKL